MKREIQISCGVAGVMPMSQEYEQWNGHVRFANPDPAVVWVSYRHQEHGSTVVDGFSQISQILDRLWALIAWLQSRNMCCNSFTILRLAFDPDYVEVTPVPLVLLQRLIVAVKRIELNDNKIGLLEVILATSKEILALIYGKSGENVITTMVGLVDEAIHQCALATQSLCLGLLSYSNAHTGHLEFFYLEHSLNIVNIQGINRSEGDAFCIHAVELTCMGEMLGDMAMIFTGARRPIQGKKYNVFASPEDLLDTWGPGRLLIDVTVPDSQQIHVIEIGGGSIVPALGDPNFFHWQRGICRYPASDTHFTSKTKILIGAATHNVACPIDETQCWPICGSSLQSLGTSEDHWMLTERQIGSQFGQYALIQANLVWTKTRGTTLKDEKLNAQLGTIDLSFLESFWGLQISLCTGVARRVRVREMVADVMVAYVEQRLPIPPEWNELLQVHRVLENFHLARDEFESWIKGLPTTMQTLVVNISRYILSILRSTGFYQQTNEFVIAWPQSADPFRCFRIKCAGKQLWTRALADSRDCATFAYITPKCLETDEFKCRRLPAAHFHTHAVSLDTAVWEHNPECTGIDPSGWTLSPGVRYWIGKPGLELTATLLSPSRTCLRIQKTGLPAKFRKRIEGVSRIRERQNTTHPATEVLILTAVPLP